MIDAVMDNEGERVNHLQLTGSDIGYAMQHNEISVHFQPILNLATDKLDGVEALSRWRSSIRNCNIPPDKFIPVAEASQTIFMLGQYMLNKSCQAVKHIEERTGHKLKIGVNFSAYQILQRATIDILDTILALTGMEPDRLVVEITESVSLYKNINCEKNLNEIRKLGVQIAVDDFGVGYSSLLYLTSFDVDEIKFDKEFTAMLGNPRAVDIISTLIEMAHRNGSKVVVEGVEEEWQLEKLRELKADYAQGYLISKPVSADVLLTMIEGRK